MCVAREGVERETRWKTNMPSPIVASKASGVVLRSKSSFSSASSVDSGKRRTKESWAHHLHTSDPARSAEAVW